MRNVTHYFLLLLIIVSSVSTRKYCGKTLIEKLSGACTNVDCEMFQEDLNKTNFLYDGILTRCCKFGCNENIIKTFCCLDVVLF
uniref:Insulin-like domain-containing protein n=1 Tax=Acrobeloides nanus TaxID=290746 RepID=A0A914C8I9_9BILA